MLGIGQTADVTLCESASSTPTHLSLPLTSSVIGLRLSFLLSGALPEHLTAVKKVSHPKPMIHTTVDSHRPNWPPSGNCGDQWKYGGHSAGGTILLDPSGERVGL